MTLISGGLYERTRGALRRAGPAYCHSRPFIVEKATWGPFCYFGYPIALHHWGFLRTFLSAAVFSWVASLVFIVVYDLNRKDFLRLPEARAAGKRFARRRAACICRLIRKVFRGRYHAYAIRLQCNVILFEHVHLDGCVDAFMGWQFFPAFGPLSRRAPGCWHMTRRDIIALTDTAFFASLYWTSVFFGGFSLWGVIKSIFDALAG